METIPLPIKVEIDAKDPQHATVVVEPCYPGYGTTLGNAMRRVLLSSLPGAAVTRVKIKGIQHEFSHLPNVKEDIVDMILNIKLLRVKIHEGEEAVLTLHEKGERIVTAKDLRAPSNVEVVTPELPIATLTDKASELEMEITVQKGRGYVPVESREREKGEIGVIAVDAVYTPMKTVNFKTEHVRVGQMTNFDRLTIDIVTDGTMSPNDAFHQAAEILVNHFALFANVQSSVLSGETTTKKKTKKAVKENKKGETTE